MYKRFISILVNIVDALSNKTTHRFYIFALEFYIKSIIFNQTNLYTGYTYME